MSMQVFEQDDVEKHLLSVGKYGAWNISRPDQVEGEGWLVSGKMVGYWSMVKHSTRGGKHCAQNTWCRR